jgi:hypothetical protein
MSKAGRVQKTSFLSGRRMDRRVRFLRKFEETFFPRARSFPYEARLPTAQRTCQAFSFAHFSILRNARDDDEWRLRFSNRRAHTEVVLRRVCFPPR